MVKEENVFDKCNEIWEKGSSIIKKININLNINIIKHIYDDLNQI